MTTYTLKNLKDVENAAEGFGLGEHMETRFARKALGLEQFGFSYQKLQPKYRQPFGHTHREQEEVYLVLSGSGRIMVEGDLVDLRQWDAIRVPAGVTRALEAGDDGLEILAMGGNPTGDAEMLQDWWGS